MAELVIFSFPTSVCIVSTCMSLYQEPPDFWTFTFCFGNKNFQNWTHQANTVEIFFFLRENQSWKPNDRWWVHDVVEAVDDVAHNRVAARWFRDFQALWRLPLPNHVLQNGQRQGHKDSYGFHGNFCEAELGSCHSPIMFYRTNRDRVIKTADLFTRMILVYFVNLNFQHTKIY